MRKCFTLACKYMLTYRKRTIAIIFSILLSTFAIVTMGSLSESARQAEVLHVKKAAGAQHVIYRELNEQDLVAIASNPKVKRQANMFYYDTWTQNGLAINLLGANEDILYMEDTEILTGQFPRQPHEIALEGWVLDRLQLPQKIGQWIDISLPQGGEMKKFQLVGIIKDRAEDKSVGKLEGYIAYHQDNLTGRDNHIASLVEFKEKEDISKEITALGNMLNLPDMDVMPNKMLLSAMGELQRIDWQLVKTAIFLMLVGGMVIYTVYNIAAVRRVQEYGLLRAIGATKKQCIAMMLGELIIMYLVGSVLGVLGGSIFLHFCQGINTDLFVKESLVNTLDVVLVSPAVVQLALIMGLGSMLAAGIKVAWMASKMTPMEALAKNTPDKTIKIKRKEGIMERSLGIACKVSYKNLLRHKKSLVLITITMTIGCSIYMVNSYETKMFERDQEYYNNLYKSKAYEFTLNVNEGSPMKQAFTGEDIETIKQLPQVEDILARGLLYSRIEFPQSALNGKFGENYLQEMQKRTMDLRLQSKIPVQGKSGFVFSNEQGNILIPNTVLGLPEDERKIIQRSLVAGNIPDPTSPQIQGILYVPKVTKKGSSFDPTGENKREPVINLKVGHSLKISYPKRGYEQSMENYPLITDYEKYKDLYSSKEVTITGIIEDLPIQDEFHLGTPCAPLCVAESK